MFNLHRSVYVKFFFIEVYAVECLGYQPRVNIFTMQLHIAFLLFTPKEHTYYFDWPKNTENILALAHTEKIIYKYVHTDIYS